MNKPNMKLHKLDNGHRHCTLLSDKMIYSRYLCSGKPTVMDKFCETGWRLFYYSVSWDPVELGDDYLMMMMIMTILIKKDVFRLVGGSFTTQ